MNNIYNTLNKDFFTNVIYYTEFTDGRKYIGQTKKGFLRRHKDHIRNNKPTHYDNVLQKHMNEAIIYPIAYGIENIEDINTQDLLNGLEVAEIMLRETFNDVNKKYGLNHTTGGFSFEVSEATKNKQSKIKKEYYNNLSDEEKEKLAKRNSEHMKGKKNALGCKHTEESKKKIKKYWVSEEGQRQKEETRKRTDEYWNSEEGQKRKEKMSNERRKDINADEILHCIEKYMTLKEVAKELNVAQNKINSELRRQGYDKFQYLRNQVISEDLIKSGLTINEFSIKYNIKTNDIKKALTQTGKKYLIKNL